MELPPEFWTAIAAVVAVIALLGTGAKWLISRDQEKERDRIAREAHEIAKRAFEADTNPQISIDAHSCGVFPGYGSVREGEVHYALRPPSPWVKPIHMLVAVVKNEGKIPVQLSRAGIRLERTGQGMDLPADKRMDVDRPLPFSASLASRDSFTINLEALLIRQLLGVLEAQTDDGFTVWVAEPIGREYVSEALKAAKFLFDDQPFQVAVGFENLVTQEQIGEEEYFPEGLFPAGLKPENPTDQ